MSQRTCTLYRPVGPGELDAIARSGWEAYPNRLPAQPFFYPVASEAYAREIAEGWNVPAYGAGYVTRVQVRADFLAAYATRIVGAQNHEEYWIAPETLPQFNAAIRGRIVVVARFPS